MGERGKAMRLSREKCIFRDAAWFSCAPLRGTTLEGGNTVIIGGFGGLRARGYCVR